MIRRVPARFLTAVVLLLAACPVARGETAAAPVITVALAPEVKDRISGVAWRAMTDECNRIWAREGIALTWSGAGAGAHVVLPLVFDDREVRKHDPKQEDALGVTVFVGRAQRILVSTARARRVISFRHGLADSDDAMTLDIAMGTLLGRVVAHEIGHAVLLTTRHRGARPHESSHRRWRSPAPRRPVRAVGDRAPPAGGALLEPAPAGAGGPGRVRLDGRAACSFSAARAALRMPRSPSLPSWQAYSNSGCSSSRVSRMPKVHGLHPGGRVVERDRPFDRVLRRRPEPLDGLEPLGRAAERRLLEEVRGFDDERVALPVAARVAHVRLQERAGHMRPPVERNDARLVHHLVADRHEARALRDVVRVAVDGRHHRARTPRVMHRT